MCDGSFWALPSHNRAGELRLWPVLTEELTLKWLHKILPQEKENPSVEISNAPSSSSYITWWKLSNPHHTLSKCIRGKGWKLIMCSPRSTLHLQQEGFTHITVSCFSVLSSARFYALKTEMLRKWFGQNTLLCSPAPLPALWGTQAF